MLNEIMKSVFKRTRQDLIIEIDHHHRVLLVVIGDAPRHKVNLRYDDTILPRITVPNRFFYTLNIAHQEHWRLTHVLA